VGPVSYAVFTIASRESVSTKRRTAFGVLGTSPYLSTDPSASAIATAMVCLLTSSPTNRIRSDMGLAPNDVPLPGVWFIHPGNTRCSLRRPFCWTGPLPCGTSSSTLPWATAYANPGAILQKGFQLCTPASCVAYQPAAAYEALATIAIGVVLLLLYRRRVPLGVTAITYVAAYAISQLIVFEFRASEPAVLLGLRQAQWTSIGVLVIGAPGLYLVWRWTTDRFLRPHDLAETAPEASLEQPRPTARR
jgi:hypothetical protein